MMLWEPNWEEVGFAFGNGDPARAMRLIAATLDSLGLEELERGRHAGIEQRRRERDVFVPPARPNFAVISGGRLVGGLR